MAAYFHSPATPPSSSFLILFEITATSLSMFLSSLSRPDAAGEELGGLGPTVRRGRGDGGDRGNLLLAMPPARKSSSESSRSGVTSPELFGLSPLSSCHNLCLSMIDLA